MIIKILMSYLLCNYRMVHSLHNIDWWYMRDEFVDFVFVSRFCLHWKLEGVHSSVELHCVE